jgi:serine/threonine-protein kinase
MSNRPSIPLAVNPGDVLAGKYRVERVLGAGGMGVVVAAHHIQLDEKVALKFLLPDALQNPEAVARFIREARAAVKIKSEHVARVSDVGQLENGAPYMVMEFLQGGDLAEWLRQKGPLPIEQAVEFVLQACVALAEAHGLGIVHRDLKPANLFCVRGADGQLSIKVLDFGISKITNAGGDGPSAAMTRTTAIMGSPLYMSPEQMNSAKKVDVRTDIWALGVVLHELIAGRPPFYTDSIMELAIKVASEPPPPLRTLRPEVSADLEAAVVKCLEKDPARRYRNVAELANALVAFAPRRSRALVERVSGIVQASGLSADVLAVPVSPSVEPPQASAGTLPPVGRTTVGGNRSRSRAWGALAGGIVAVAVGVTFFTYKKTLAHHDESPPTASIAAAALPPQPPPVLQPATPADTKPTEASPPPTDSITTPAPTAQQPLRPAPVKTKASAKTAAATGAAGVSTPAPVPAANPKPNCDPNYTLDDQGRKVWKPECFK